MSELDAGHLALIMGSCNMATNKCQKMNRKIMNKSRPTIADIRALASDLKACQIALDSVCEDLLE